MQLCSALVSLRPQRRPSCASPCTASSGSAIPAQAAYVCYVALSLARSKAKTHLRERLDDNPAKYRRSAVALAFDRVCRDKCHADLTRLGVSFDD